MDSKQCSAVRANQAEMAALTQRRSASGVSVMGNWVMGNWWMWHMLQPSTCLCNLDTLTHAVLTPPIKGPPRYTQP